jgi:hypothetical protein
MAHQSSFWNSSRIARKEDSDMRGLLIATLSLGLLLVSGCVERRYSTYDPYYSNGYYGWNSYEDACYRQWLSECHYSYVDYHRLGRKRRHQYWEWRQSNDARLRQDPRFAGIRPAVSNDHDHDGRPTHDRHAAQNHGGDRDSHTARNTGGNHSGHTARTSGGNHEGHQSRTSHQDRGGSQRRSSDHGHDHHER